jgi:hypothetical protein
MKNLIFFTLIIGNLALAEDVYNFNFKKTELSEVPKQEEEITPWSLSVGYGFSNGHIGIIEGYTLGLKYTINKYFGLSGTALIEDKYTDHAGSSDSSRYPSYHNKYDFGGVFTPLSLKILNQQFFDFSVHGGLTTVHDFTSEQAFKQDYQAFLGLGMRFEFSKNFAIEGITKILASDSFLFRKRWGAVASFTYITYNLVWRI